MFIEVRLLSFHRDCKTLSLMITLQRISSQVLEKEISGVIEAISQRDREIMFYNYKFSVVNTLKKGRSGAYSQVLTGTNSEFFWQC